MSDDLHTAAVRRQWPGRMGSANATIHALCDEVDRLRAVQMGDDLRERIARALKESFYPDRKSRAPESEWLRRADAVLAVLRDTPKVCPTCGSDDPKVQLVVTLAEQPREPLCPDPFHSQGEPCEMCGGTGRHVTMAVIGGKPWTEPCPRGCTPEGEKK